MNIEHKLEFFEGKTAREIASELISATLPRLQKEEEAAWTEGYTDLAKIEVDHYRRRWFSEVPGSMAPDHVVIGAIQAQENKGYIVTEAQKLIVPTQLAYETNDSGSLIANIALIFKLLAEAPKNEADPYWNYTQYDSFDQILEKNTFPAATQLTLSSMEILEKIHAGWSSQIAGGALGTIIEGYTTDNIRKVFGEVRGYLRKPSTHNDDNLFELAAIDAICKKGVAVTADDIALEWIANIAYAWSAEEVALANLKRGIFPPQSAKLNNPWNEWIGAQMRGAIFGLVAPGDPKLAAKLAWLDGSISHINNGIMGEVFNAVLTSISWIDSDVRSIVKKTIDLIPNDCEYYSVVKFAHEQCLKYDNWEAAWRVCEDKYRRYNWIHTYPNAAAQIIALYYAEADFDECMHIIAMCGQDVDCNAGMIGTIYGVIHGFAGIAKHWLEPFNDEFESLYRGYEKTTLKNISEVTYQALVALKGE